MFRKLKEYLKHCEEDSKNNINASKYNDKVATKTDWKPLNTSVANFNTCVLESAGKNLLYFKTTMSMKMFSGFFIVIGLVLLSFVGPMQDGRWFPETIDEGLGQLMCLTFTIAGIYLLYFTSPPIAFDGNKRLLIKGRGHRRKAIYFSEIYALQLVPYYFTSSDGPDYYNYQLNVVLENAERFHIVSYYDKGKARDDAAAISWLTGKILWDVLKE